MKPWLILAGVLILFSGVPAWAESVTPQQLEACLGRNVPEPDSLRAVRVSARDRAGEERESIVKIHGRRTDEGLREVLVEFVAPEEVEGGSFLMLERTDGSEMWFRASRDSTPRKVRGDARSLALFGSDFTYEDFEHLLAFRQPETTKRLENSRLMGRDVYVVETSTSNSSYDRIVSSIDKERCVLIRAELYEAGRGQRKELMLNPSRVVRKGGVWVPQVAVMTDLRDGTSTMLLVDSTEQDVVHDAALFRPLPAVGAEP